MKIIISVGLFLLGAMLFSLSMYHSRWQLYHHESIPFEIKYPPFLKATTMFSSNRTSHYSLVRFEIDEDVFISVAIGPENRTVNDVWKYGYSTSDIPQRKMIVDGYEAVLVKSLVGDPPYTLDQKGYQIFLVAKGREYYISVHTPFAEKMIEKMLESFKVK